MNWKKQVKLVGLKKISNKLFLNTLLLPYFYSFDLVIS